MKVLLITIMSIVLLLGTFMLFSTVLPLLAVILVCALIYSKCRSTDLDGN